MVMSLMMVINEVEKEALEEALADVHAVNVQHSAIFTVGTVSYTHLTLPTRSTV